jgi:hypothetical protein
MNKCMLYFCFFVYFFNGLLYNLTIIIQQNNIQMEILCLAGTQPHVQTVSRGVLYIFLLYIYLTISVLLPPPGGALHQYVHMFRDWRT